MTRVAAAVPGPVGQPAAAPPGRRRAVKAPRRSSSRTASLDLCLDRALEDLQGARVLHGPRRPDDRRAARLPPGARAEAAGVQPGEPGR